MSTKVLRSLTDEKTDIQKQLGCMNGIFQLFGRANGHNHKRLPPGTFQNHGMEQKYTTETLPVGKEKLMATVELSRASFSSSCSSSTFSSADWNKRTQSELSSSCHSNFPEMTPLVLTQEQPSPSHLSRQSLDLRDIVKDSMCKEARGLSVQTKRKEESAGPAIKHIDSPRPLQQHKHVQPKGTRRDASLRVLAKLQDGPWNSNGEKFGSLPLAPRDTPRYSYDERVSRDKLKSTTNLKELPRLSLDSRVRHVRSSATEYRTNYLSGEDREARDSNQILFENQEPGSNKKPSTIVARLMGFEPIRDSIPTDHQMIKVKSCLEEDSETISPSLKVRVGNRQRIVSGSPKGYHEKSVSPRLKKQSIVTESASGSTFPLEPASWRQTDNNQGSQKQSLSYQEAPTKPPLASSSIYSEIKKRLNELEFITAGKDLRALKQIIEAMEKTREISDNKTKEQTSNSKSCTTKGSSNRSFDHASTEWRKHNTPVSPNKGSNSPKNHGTQIVKRNPDKVNDNPVIPTDGKSCQRTFWSGEDADNMTNFTEKQTAKQITPRNNSRESSSWPLFNMEEFFFAESIRSVHCPEASQQMGRENPASFRKSPQKLSPRLQQKKHGMEKLSSFTNQPSGMRMSRAHLINQPTDAGSPRKLKQKSANLQTRHDQISRSTTHTRNMHCKGGTGSMQSENAIDLATQNAKERENKSTDQIKDTYSPYKTNSPNKEDFTAKYSDERLTSEHTTTQEQPSPVSVLDITFIEEDISPVKKISTASRDNCTQSSDDEEGSAVYTDNFKKNRRSNSSSGIDQRELDRVDHLVHKVGLVNTSQNKSITNQIKFLTNPDHRYIAQILSTAGLFICPGSTPTTIQIHPAGITVNPDLFHILEKLTELEVEHHEKNARSKQKEKVQRKLVFDAVNEILACKDNHLQGSGESRIACNKMGERIMTGEKLLEDLCTKLDHQQATPYDRLNDKGEELTSILRAELMDQHESWAGYSSQLPEIVLDIERMIFKDLIDEVVSRVVSPQ